jgi:hypothetical protein
MMIFSHQTRGAIAQVLSVISTAGAETFLYKHLGVSEVFSFFRMLASATPEALKTMLNELLTNNKVLYAAAPVKHVFNSALDDLARWALHDGWIVENGTLVRVTPAAEEATAIRDKFLHDIAHSGLDMDGAIKTAVEKSSKDFVSQPPDFNGSTTKVRIALETVARRAATAIAKKKGGVHPEDSWEKALPFLRSSGVIEPQEEEILARVYTFISPGAHIPRGVTAEEWARLARTFGLSSAYFLLRKYVAD